jgi:pimeloyl-ACP methyl ester carboxylesterase
MHNRFKLTVALAIATCALSSLQAQQVPPSAAARNTPAREPVGPILSDKFHTTYVRLGSSDDEALLYEPAIPRPNAHIALVYVHPNGNVFNMEIGPQMASRGYRVLLINHHGQEDDAEQFAPGIARGITYLRTLSGVRRVVIAGHSGGGHLVTWYQNVAEHGPAACQGPAKIYPCSGDKLTGLAKPDGLILLDSTLGAFHQMSSVDPAVDGDKRQAALDMFSAANGYDMAAKRATYSPEFAKRFYAAQSARNTSIVEQAIARLNAINAGKGQFSDDEPLVIRGMGENAAGARLYQPDPAFAAHTKKPHVVLKADGTRPETIVRSVRPPTGQQAVAALNTLHVMSNDTTVRRFLANSAIRTTADYEMTADDIVGVEWASAATSTPANAEGVTVPTLVMPMTCHYLVVPNEIVYDHLGSKDKTYVAVEGAVHNFTPCRPEYGDTVKRTFDEVDAWLGKARRF